MTDKMKPRYGSDLIVDLMKALGIEYAALAPGATFRGIHDSIVNYGGNERPKVIFCCHEECSVAVAHGYAKVTGKPMATLTHNIVGLQHASMAIFNTWCDRVPVLVMGGTGPMDVTRRRPWIDWIHTALVQGNQVRDYVKWDDQPHNLRSVPMSLLRGHRIATTEPKGPVYLCFDADIQEDEIKEPVEMPDLSQFLPPSPIQADPQALQQAARLLYQAESPLIIADYFGRHPEAVPSLIELAELLAIPVVDKGNRFNFPNTHPLDVTGMEQELLKKADVILALDVQDLYGSLSTVNRTTRVSEPATSPSARIIHISLNEMLIRSWASDYHRLQPTHLPITADTSLAVPELLRMCREIGRIEGEKKRQIEARFSALRAGQEKQRAKWRKEASDAAGRKEISTAFLASEIWEVIKGEDWILVNGTSNRWARKVWDWTRPGQYLGDSGGAGLGYGLPGSIGAALAHLNTGKLCIDIQSDGDFLMAASGLWTAAHHKIPLLIVMFNNRSFYNSEDHARKIAQFRGWPVENAKIGTHLDNPPVNFAKMAESYGVKSEGPIERPEELRPALQRALGIVKGERRPVLVDVVSDPR